MSDQAGKRTTPLTVPDIAAAATPFVQSAGGSCAGVPFTLAAGGSCTIQYSFVPSVTGTYRQNLTITANVRAVALSAIEAPAGGLFNVFALLPLLAITAPLGLRRRASTVTRR